MKKLLVIFFISLLAKAVPAQSNTILPAKMTKDFADSLSVQIKRIIPPGYNIKLLYMCDLPADGKFTRPLIWREVADGTVADNDFVQKMRFLIMAAPAWKPAFDTASNTNVASVVRFFVVIINGKTDIRMDTKGADHFDE